MVNKYMKYSLYDDVYRETVSIQKQSVSGTAPLQSKTLDCTNDAFQLLRYSANKWQGLH